jgi:hypothetical protein
MRITWRAQLRRRRTTSLRCEYCHASQPREGLVCPRSYQPCAAPTERRPPGRPSRHAERIGLRIRRATGGSGIAAQSPLPPQGGKEPWLETTARSRAIRIGGRSREQPDGDGGAAGYCEAGAHGALVLPALPRQPRGAVTGEAPGMHIELGDLDVGRRAPQSAAGWRSFRLPWGRPRRSPDGLPPCRTRSS